MQLYNTTIWKNRVDTRLFATHAAQPMHKKLPYELTPMQVGITINWRMVIVRDGSAFLMRFEIESLDGLVINEDGRGFPVTDGCIVSTDLNLAPDGFNYIFQIKEVLVYNNGYIQIIL